MIIFGIVEHVDHHTVYKLLFGEASCKVCNVQKITILSYFHVNIVSNERKYRNDLKVREAVEMRRS